MTTSGDKKKVPSRSKKTRATMVAPMQTRGGDESIAVRDRPLLALAPEDRTRLIAESAYYLAEARGLAAGHEIEDWLNAERAVDERLSERTS
jgi:hypothetical protein